MPCSDRTQDFRKVIREQENVLPTAKRRKTSRQATDTERNAQLIAGKEYVAEAYIIVSIVRTATVCVPCLSTVPAEPYKHIDADAFKHPSALPQRGFAGGARLPSALAKHRPRWL
jgi:syntaxin 18